MSKENLDLQFQFQLNKILKISNRISYCKMVCKRVDSMGKSNLYTKDKICAWKKKDIPGMTRKEFSGILKTLKTKIFAFTILD